MSPILTAVIVVVSIGLIAGIGLGIASIVFRVKVNETEQKLLDVLPGANCGSCSFAGCADYAKALATGKVKTTLCPVGGEEGVKKICAILGVEAASTQKKVAFVHCSGHPDCTPKAVDYRGVQTCRGAKLVCLGESKCKYGCLGHGDCVEACQYNAISIVNGVAKVDCSKCRGCGMCVNACPKNLISLVVAGDVAKVACHNEDKGAETRAACTAGCIGCTKCVKTCPNEAIAMVNNHASVNTEKCTGCGACAEACPMKAIKLN